MPAPPPASCPSTGACDGGAGNPPDPHGHAYRTSYLWEEVFARDSLLDLLARFIHLQTDEKRDDKGRKARVETMIFPRYHQLEAVRRLVDTARREGVGHNALVEHSAGSGKSNTIAWLAHRLASLHDTGNARVFDSVIVVTDRVVLDSQLQDTIYQFEHKRGVVRKIDESSRQLAEALESAVPIVITTLQKFPFVSRHLLRMAEERGTETEPEAGTGIGSGTGTGTRTLTVAEVRTGAEAGTEGESRIGGEAEISAEAESGPGAGLGAGVGRFEAAAGAGALPARRYAVIIDEAHSSQAARRRPRSRRCSAARRCACGRAVRRPRRATSKAARTWKRSFSAWPNAGGRRT